MVLNALTLLALVCFADFFSRKPDRCCELGGLDMDVVCELPNLEMSSLIEAVRIVYRSRASINVLPMRPCSSLMQSTAASLTELSEENTQNH